MNRPPRRGAHAFWLMSFSIASAGCVESPAPASSSTTSITVHSIAPASSSATPSSSPTAEPKSEVGAADNRTPSASGDPACTWPMSAHDAVIHVERHVLPRGKDVSIEAGEVAFDVGCAPGISCSRVTADRMMVLIGLAKTASTARHSSNRSSPHYGSRSITVRSPTTRCEIDDSSESPILSEDRQLFYGAFDVIGGELAPPTSPKP